jgi:hypothetical protein
MQQNTQKTNEINKKRRPQISRYDFEMRGFDFAFREVFCIEIDEYSKQREKNSKFFELLIFFMK